MLDTISILLSLLRFDLWPKMWSILENVPCAFEKKVYSSAFGWNVLKISMRSTLPNHKTCVSFLIFCFDDLSTGMSWVLKSPSMIVLLSIYLFMSVSVRLFCLFVFSVCRMYWGAPMLGAQIFTIIMFSSWVNPLVKYVVSFLISCNLYFKVW